MINAIGLTFPPFCIQLRPAGSEIPLPILGITVSRPHQDLVLDANLAAMRSVTKRQNNTVPFSGGSHDLDNLEDAMQPLFIAAGPMF